LTAGRTCRGYSTPSDGAGSKPRVYNTHDLLELTLRHGLVRDVNAMWHWPWSNAFPT
jgi:hypothetical protein